jgi:hypothetical protein
MQMLSRTTRHRRACLSSVAAVTTSQTGMAVTSSSDRLFSSSQWCSRYFSPSASSVRWGQGLWPMAYGARDGRSASLQGGNQVIPAAAARGMAGQPFGRVDKLLPLLPAQTGYGHHGRQRPGFTALA